MLSFRIWLNPREKVHEPNWKAKLLCLAINIMCQMGLLPEIDILYKLKKSQKRNI